MDSLYNRPTIGRGIFTSPDLARILRIPNRRARWLLNDVWDNRFGERFFGERYSWNVNNSKAVNFLVLVEFKVVLLLQDLGLSTRYILKARNEIARDLQKPYPFASQHLLANAKKIWYKVKDDVVDADESHQLNFAQCVENYTRHIDFSEQTNEAIRLWPIGRENSIVIDPHHQFGQPTIAGTNVVAETIFLMNEAGESVETLSALYSLSVKQIQDAIRFHKQAA